MKNKVLYTECMEFPREDINEMPVQSIEPLRVVLKLIAVKKLLNTIAVTLGRNCNVSVIQQSGRQIDSTKFPSAIQKSSTVLFKGNKPTS